MVESGCILRWPGWGSVPSMILCLTKGSWESNLPVAYNFQSWKSNQHITAPVAGWDSNLALSTGLSQASACGCPHSLLNRLDARWVTSDLLGTHCILWGIENTLSSNVPTHLSHCGQKNTKFFLSKLPASPVRTVSRFPRWVGPVFFSSSTIYKYTSDSVRS